MKKRILTKVITMAMACALVVGNTGLTVHAATDDGAYHGNGREDGGGGSASLDDGGSSSNSGSSSSDSGSSNSGNSNYDDGAYHGNGREDGGGGSASLSDGGSSSTASYTAPKAAGKAASAGKETFRAVAKTTGAGTYKVTHKGVEIATFSLMDSEKKAVSCTAVTLKQREDKKYAIDFRVDDATGLTVGAPLDRTYMYNTLGVSYVTINDEIVIDIETEAATNTTK